LQKATSARFNFVVVACFLMCLNSSGDGDIIMYVREWQMVVGVDDDSW